MRKISPPHSVNISDCDKKKKTKASSKERNSSVETFRILATFLVLIAHFNGWFAGGMPEHFDLSNISSFRIGQMVIESLSVICVNCFLIISGFYGIRLKLKTFYNIYILLVCIYVPFYLIMSLYQGDFHIKGLLRNVLAFSRESYFVQCYLMLVFLSPILNAFVEKHGKSILFYIIVFAGIELWFECIMGNESLGFNNGYSLIHFILMYMLARMANLYQEEILSVKSKYWFYGYIFCSIVICGMYMLGMECTWDYSNPIVIISSFCLFFPFLYKHYINKWINWIASSTFAVFLIHTCPPFSNTLRKIDNQLLSNYSYSIYLPSIMLMIFFVFVVCVLYDKARLKLTSPMFDYIWHRIERYKLNKEYYG